MSDVAVAGRTRLRRAPQLGSDDPVVIRSIIDAGLICHLGLSDHDGHPVVVPTIHARAGDTLYVHGSAASHTLRRLADAVDVCCTITHLDGIVVARSGFWSSMNYRSVMIFGVARLVVDPDEEQRALDAIVDQVLPGRSREIRRPTRKELAATKVIALSIDGATAKIWTGGPNDDPGDLDADVWAGTIPIRLVAGAPVRAANVATAIATPPSVAEVGRRLAAE